MIDNVTRAYPLHWGASPGVVFRGSGGGYYCRRRSVVPRLYLGLPLFPSVARGAMPPTVRYCGGMHSWWRRIRYMYRGTRGWADTKRAGEGRCVIIRHVGGHAPEPNCYRTQWSEGLVTGRAKGSARGLCRAMPWHSWAQRALGSRAFSIVREGPHFHTTGQSTGSGARINCSAAICADSGPSFVSFFFFFPPTNANQSGLGMQGSGSGFPNKVRAVTHFLGSFRRPFSQ